MVERVDDGLTLILTTDLEQKNPVITGDHVTYTGIASYVHEASEAKQQLARAVERAESAKTVITHANA